MANTIVLYFGSFNPIHRGHIAIAWHTMEKLLGEKLLSEKLPGKTYKKDLKNFQLQFVISPQSPFKPPANKNSSPHSFLCDFSHRVAMANLAVAFLNQKASKIIKPFYHSAAEEKNFSHPTPFGVNTIEDKLPPPHYTYFTLKEIMAKTKTKTKYFLLIGEDNYKLLPQWKEAAWIIDNFSVIVYPRVGKNKKNKMASLKTPKNFELQKNAFQKIIFLRNAKLLSFSATAIRASIAEKKNIQKFVPAAVASYIEKKNLYR